MTLRALDLFSGAGGAARGLQRAGFHVTGVDIEAQPRYIGERFIQANALALGGEFLASFDFIWASPPCQAHTAMKTMHNRKEHVDLIPQTRAMLKWFDAPYVIENVVGAPLINPFTLCGTMFSLQTDCGADLHRHRIFEASFPVMPPKCWHVPGRPVIGVYGGHYRNRKRAAGRNRGDRGFTADDGRKAMQIDWMTGDEISQAIPPAYAEFIAKSFLSRAVKERAA